MIINNILLDDDQLKPILENPKYSLIIAGAGSGKTLTLLGKIKYLVEVQKCKPEEILCLSFTNETVLDLKEKIKINTKEEIDVLTFHKLALKILGDRKINICADSFLFFIAEEFFKSLFLSNDYLLKLLGKNFFLRPSLKKEKAFLNSKNGNSLKKSMLTFLKLYKANHYNDEDFLQLIKRKKHQNFLILTYALFLLYESEKKAQNLYDFDDLIEEAICILKANDLHLPYKYILIDEFQDTSRLRFDLILEIIKQTEASLCVIGDDYQSIYRFSGCDLSLFLNFTEIFKEAKIYKLLKTYRNSKQLIHVAGSFIMQNPYQIKKKLTSPKSLSKPIVIVYYEKKDNVLNELLKRVDATSLLVLGRNETDLKDSPYDKKYHFKYLTVHKAKGLEAQNVIVLNLEDKTYGFPNQLKNENVFSLISPPAKFPFDEERRLFYVALTRTKNKVYLLVNKKRPSLFIREIHRYKNDIEIMRI